jgi:hypothetical protein
MESNDRRNEVHRRSITALGSSPAELYSEFAAAPIGKHSPNLQLVLLYMRGAPVPGKYVLVAQEPHKSWYLGELTGVRGDPLKVYQDVRYTDLAEAERDIYRRRWKALMGEELER